MGMVHGGMTATLMDSITTWCNFVSREGHAGVTTDLSVSYLKGIDPKKHPTVTLVGRVDQEGLNFSKIFERRFPMTFSYDASKRFL